MLIVATLMPPVVLLFSANAVTVLLRVTAVGGLLTGVSLTSVTLSVKFVLASGVAPTLRSSTLIVTSY